MQACIQIAVTSDRTELELGNQGCPMRHMVCHRPAPPSYSTHSYSVGLHREHSYSKCKTQTKQTNQEQNLIKQNVNLRGRKNNGHTIDHNVTENHILTNKMVYAQTK